jgi:hypothetical protein
MFLTMLAKEARDGLMRAWLEILRERHPGIKRVALRETGLPADPPEPGSDPEERSAESQ